MAALLVSAVRQRIVAALAALTGWRESTLAPDTFPGEAPRMTQHLHFAVAVPETPALDERQKVTLGAPVQTAVEVRFLHKVRTDAPNTDYDDFLDAEQAALVAVAGIARTDLTLGYEGASRESLADGTLALSVLRFTVQHRLALL